MKQIRKRLTYANVMSSLAVFLILGGATAVAATKIGTKDLKAGAVKTGKLAKEAVAAGKIKNGAVTEVKLGDAAVTTNKLADNAVTAPKIANLAVSSEKLANDSVTNTKIANAAVTAAKLGSITVQTETVPVNAGANGSANVACPAGQRAIAGGGAWDTFSKDLSYLSTRPILSLANVNAMSDGQVPGGWRSSGTNGTGALAGIQVWVLCLA